VIVNKTVREIRLYTLARDLDTNEIGLYGYVFAARDVITGEELGDYLSAISDKIDVFYSSGNYGDIVNGNQYVKNQELNLSFIQDFNTRIKEKLSDADKDIILNMMSGRTFLNKIPVGTIGNSINKERLIKQSWGNLFNFELNYLKVPMASDEFGYPVKIRNLMFECIERRQIPFMLEFISYVGSGYVANIIPAVTMDDCKLDEGNVNNFKLKLKKYSDRYDKNNSIIGGSQNTIDLQYIYDNQTIPTPTGSEVEIDYEDGYSGILIKDENSLIDLYLKENIGEVEVNCIIYSNTLPTGANINDVILLINTDGKSYLTKYYDNGKWALISTGNLGNNFRVFSTNYLIGNNLAERVNHNCFSSVTAVENENIEGLQLYGYADNYGDSYICKIYMWNRFSQDFDEYND